MRITILALGSRGDVQPYVALGLRLKAAGDEVCIAAYRRLEDLVVESGLYFTPVAGDPNEMLSKIVGSRHTKRTNSLGTIWRLLQAGNKVRIEAASDCWNAVKDCDLIIASPVSDDMALHFHEKLETPVVRTSSVPWIPSRYYSAFLARYRRSRSSSANLLTHILIRQLTSMVTRPTTNRLRTQVLGLDAIPMRCSLGTLDSSRLPTLLYHSPAVFPAAPDWSDRVHVTGFWFLDQPADWQPPSDLVEFLDAGPPPVYVGFGSVPSEKPEEVTRLVATALQRAGQRGVLLTGWNGLSKPPSSKDILVIDAIPHDWLFPRMAAVVHHGGAGTTAAGFRAGVPSVVIPSFGDQPFWGSRVHALGVGPRPIPRRQLTVERLSAAISVAVNDPDIRCRATNLGEGIRREDGVGRAVELIHEYMEEPDIVWGRQRERPVDV